MKIAIFGHSGMVGSAIVRALKNDTKYNYELLGASSAEVDLCNAGDVQEWFSTFRPEVVFHVGARVGGIGENIQYPVEFLGENVLMAINVITAAAAYKVKKLIYIGSSCVYPAYCTQPMSEDMILTGPFEPTNEGYALGKVVGMKLCEYYKREYEYNFISVLPCNLYGPNDDWSESGHVMASLIKKIIHAREHNLGEVILWGTGNPRREFLHVDDCADACILAFKKYSGEMPLNIGSGEDLTILDLATLIADIVGWEGKFHFNTKKPDGMQQKLLDVSRLKKLEFEPQYNLRRGIERTVREYEIENGISRQQIRNIKNTSTAI